MDLTAGCLTDPISLRMRQAWVDDGGKTATSVVIKSSLATLVHQGSDLTSPHQALGDPTERHAFLEGVNAPWRHQVLFGPPAVAVRWGRSPPSQTILPTSPPVAVRYRAGSHPAKTARLDVPRSSSAAQRGEVGPRRMGPSSWPWASRPGAVRLPRRTWPAPFPKGRPPAWP
jgi:hypothetical protein